MATHVATHRGCGQANFPSRLSLAGGLEEAVSARLLASLWATPHVGATVCFSHVYLVLLLLLLLLLVWPAGAKSGATTDEVVADALLREVSGLEPCTLSPEPCTLSPERSTLSPAPCTLNPGVMQETRYTLSPSLHP